jgi:hypothetical protein
VGRTVNWKLIARNPVDVQATPLLAWEPKTAALDSFTQTKAQ